MLNHFHSVDFDDVIPTDLYAVREFHVYNGYLVGLSHPQAFAIDETNVAQCTKVHDSVPDPKCTCGFYVYDNPKYWWTTKPHALPDGVVKAVVRVSGKIVVCARGLRAEELDIIALACNTNTLLPENCSKLPVYNTVHELLAQYTVKPLDRPDNVEPNLFTEFKKFDKSSLIPRKPNEIQLLNKSLLVISALIAITMVAHTVVAGAMILMSCLMAFFTKDKFFWSIPMICALLVLRDITLEWESLLHLNLSIAICAMLLVGVGQLTIQFTKFMKCAKQTADNNTMESFNKTIKYAPYQTLWGKQIRTPYSTPNVKKNSIMADQELNA